MPRESEIQRSIIEALEKQGIYVVRVVIAGRAGTPDLICCVNGDFLALEVKTPAGRLTALQRVEVARVRHANGASAVVRSVDEALAAVEQLA